MLNYKYVDGMLEKRTPYRAEHLAILNQMREDGKILCAGPMTDSSGALFIFKTTQADVMEFIEKDPYVKADLVPSYEIKEWIVGIGGDVVSKL